MSLTSYRAAPPRVTQERIDRRRKSRHKVNEGVWIKAALDRPGSVLLSRVLRHSTIGAEGFHGRVRDGIGWLLPRHYHQANQASLCRRRQSAGGYPRM